MKLPALRRPELKFWNKLLQLKPLQFIPYGTKFSFVSHYRLALIETAALAVLTVMLLATVGLNYGVDFRGGMMMEIRTTDGPADVGAVRSKVGALNLGEVQVQQFGAPNEVLIRTETQPGGEPAQQEMLNKVRKALGDKIEIRRVEVVGATVSAELIRDAILALFFASLGIFVYIWFRFEWQFSVSAIVALLHDVAMVVCLFSIFQIEFDLTIVAALLTLIGYAVNDTVVTFDRVRENLRKYKKMPLDELIDLSVNETLSRTVMTAGAVLLTLLALFFFGGPVIRGFMIAMLFGMAVSSYTSMYVAAPLLYVIGVHRDWGMDAITARTARGTSARRAARTS
ncbi:MAG: protein translocase subunit SecF [Hyphomicrobiaceae bacterium]